MGNTNSSAAISLSIPPALTLTVTREQFVELAIANRDLQLERTARGELIVNPPTGGDTGKSNLSIGARVWFWNYQNKQRGHSSAVSLQIPV